jgi:hypothetical protein
MGFLLLGPMRSQGRDEAYLRVKNINQRPAAFDENAAQPVSRIA